MPQSRISVRLSRPDQDDLRAHAEHASALPELMRALSGGAAPDALKRVMRAVIADTVAGTGLRVEIAGTDDPLGGAEEANLVNRLTSDQRHGIQIEQQPSARSGTMPGSSTPRWQAIAAAVAVV